MELTAGLLPIGYPTGSWGHFGVGQFLNVVLQETVLQYLFEDYLQDPCRIVFLKDYRHDSYRILQELSYRRVASKILWDI